MDLIKFFAKKTILVNLIAVFVVITGFFTFFKSPKEIFPNIDMGVVVITAIYPQAAPDDVEQLVTDPIEDSIINLSGIKEITSWSSESLGMIVVQADSGVDVLKLKDDVQSAVDKISDLPDEMSELDVFEISPDEFGILMMGVTGGTYEERRETTKRILERTSKIKGMGSPDKWGYVDRAIWVDAGKEELDRYGMTLFSLMNVLGDRNIAMPAGNKKIGDTEYSVRFLSEQKTAGEVGNIIVRSNDAGKKIRIKNVAEVEEGFQDDASMFRIEGKESIIIIFKKLSGFDAITVSNEVKKTARELENSVSKDVKVTFTDDFAERLKDRLFVLYSNGAFGAGLIVVLLFLMLRPSVAAMTALGLPIAMGAAFLVTDSAGITINMISLFGFIMVVGLLVDNAIVIGENVFQHMERGKTSFKAAVDGAKEMAMPIIASVSTTIAAFLPLLMVGGMMGDFMGVIPKIVMIALAASFVQSFFILPNHLAHFVKPKKNLSDRGEAREHWFEIMKSKYTKMLRAVLKHRIIFSVSMVILFFASIYLGFAGRGVVFSDTQINEISIKMKTTSTFGLDDTTRVVEKIEKKLLTMDRSDLDTVASYVGYQESQAGPPIFAPNLAQIRIILQLEDDRKTRDANVITNRVRELVGDPENVTEMTIDIVKGGPGSGMDINYIITGDSYEEIKNVADHTIKRMKEFEMKVGPWRNKTMMNPITELKTDLEEGKKEIRFIVDEAKASMAGINLSQVSMIMRASIAGLNIKSIKRNSENVDIMVRIKEEDINTVDDILDLKIPNMMGQRIPLRTIVTAEKGQGYSMLKHRDGKKAIGIEGSIDKEKTNVAEVNREILKIVEDMREKFPEVEIITGGEFQEMTEAFVDLGTAFAVAMALIFIILATLFGSLMQPLVIMAAIPFGFIGVMLTLFLHWETGSFMAFMGFVGLSGVVVNNSLIMVNFMNQGIKELEDKEEAVLEGARSRLRPIILTTITTAIGLFPLAYGWFGGNDPMLMPMALVFSWGLLFASFVTLFIIPSLYVIMNNIRTKMKKIAGRDAESDFYMFKDENKIKYKKTGSRAEGIQKGD
ncbi:MAG: efflux RND transporter permease subunit [Candidatus Goldiibacteriota bacterium]